MKVLYIECKMGAAGDMLMSALSELLDDPADFYARLGALGIPNVSVICEKQKKCGIEGTHTRVSVNGDEEGENIHEHKHHTKLSDVENIINALPLKQSVRQNAAAVYKLIADAESKVHGCEVNEIHFHEVGAMDAVTDVVGVCMLMDEIGADRVAVSPVNLGGGFVKCAHGVLPVPAPATAELLKGLPVYSDSDEGEFCTPTGAALLKYFADEFSAMPCMNLEKTGCGLATKDFSRANVLRVFLGNTDISGDTVYELHCNVDDMTGEELAFACGMIFAAGARDVFTIPVFMKKNRPAYMLNILCTADKKSEVVTAVFRHTTTIGIREIKCERHILERKLETMSTPFGDIQIKSSRGFGVTRKKAEADDIERIARENSMTIWEVKKHLGL